MTKKQHQILAFVRDFIRRNKYAPSNRELCEQFGLWPSGTDQHLRLIEKKGYLRRVPNTARGLVLL